MMNTKRRESRTASGRPIRVLVVEDSKPVRQRLCHAFQADGRFLVVGAAANGRAGVHLTATLHPDLVLMDLHMPEMDGLEATRQLKSQPGAPKVCMVTISDLQSAQAQATAAGVDRLVSKAEIVKTLPEFLSALYQEHQRSARRAGAAQSSKVPRGPSAGSGGARLAREALAGGLTPRERQVLQLVAEGRSSKGIADCLNISVATVDTHRSNLMRKLDLHSVSQLVRYAIRNNLIEP